MDEIWKDIKGYEGIYQVSSYGRVKSLRRDIVKKNKYGYISTFHWEEKVLSLCENGSPYLVIHLRKNNKRERKYVHRLVAETFIENPENKTTVNHLDYNKHNNNVENLEWVTVKENVQYSRQNMRKIKKNANKKTGYKYIGIRRNKYRVYIHFRFPDFRYDKCFNTLSEAIASRDEILKSLKVDINAA